MIPAKSVRAVLPHRPADEAALLAQIGFCQGAQPNSGLCKGDMVCL